MTRVFPAVRFGLPIAVLFVFAAAAGFAQQTVSPPDPRALPPLYLRAPGLTSLESGSKGAYSHITGGVEFTIGDLHLRADTLDFYRESYRLEATGNVVVTRGDEEMRGDSFVFENETGSLTVLKGRILSPPLSVEGETVTRTPTELRATNARVGLGDANGSGELGLRVEELRAIPDSVSGGGAADTGQRLLLRNATVSLYGVRLFTIRRATFHFDPAASRRSKSPTSQLPPLTVRSSRISGFLVGAAVPFTLGPDTALRTELDLSTRQGIQYGLSLRKTLVGDQGGTAPRGLRGATPGGVDPSVAGQSPLRQALKARPLPAPPDPVLDFDDVLTTPDSFTHPLSAAQRDLHLELNLTGNREFGFRRQGPLLLSRQPEAVLSGRLPFSQPIAATENGDARAALRRLRLYLEGRGDTGKYDEVQLENDHLHARHDRLGGSINLGTRPLLLGSHTLVQGTTSYHAYNYDTDQHYEYTESSLSGVYIFRQRTSLGASLIARDTGGSSPFLWDQVDTNTEAQLRGQIGLGARAHYTLAGLARYDVSQRRLFDYDITLAFRGRDLEPRLTYRRLNRQLGISVSLPGLSY